MTTIDYDNQDECDDDDKHKESKKYQVVYNCIWSTDGFELPANFM